MSEALLNKNTTPTFSPVSFFFLFGIFLLPLLYIPGLSFELVGAGKFIFLFIILLFLGLFGAARIHMKRSALFIPTHVLYSSTFAIFSVTIFSSLFSKIPDVSWVTVGDGTGTFLFFYILFAILFFTVYVFRKKELVLHLYEVVIFSFLMLLTVSAIAALFKNTEVINAMAHFVGSAPDVVVFAGLVFILSLFVFKKAHNNFGRVFATIAITLSVVVLFFSFLGETGPSFSLMPIENMTTLQETAKESPLRALFGSGPNTATYQFDLYAPEQTPLTSWNAHVLTQTGLLGGFAWAIFFFLFVFFGIESFLEKNKYASFNFIIALYLWTFSFLYPMGLTLTVFTFLFTGVYIASLSYSEQDKENFIFSLEKRWARAGFVFLIFIIFFSSVFGIILYTKKTMSFFYFQKALAAENEGLFLEDMDNALRVSKEGAYYRHLANFYTLKTEEASRFNTFTERDERVVRYGELAVSNGKKATEIAPHDYRNWTALGKIYFLFARLGIGGAYTEGKRVYSEARRLSINNEALLLEMAEFVFLANDKEFAKGLLKDLLWRHPESKRARERLQEWDLQ